MAYVNVAEWTSQHVGDWLYGLDDSILPYVQFFVNNQINGCRLLLLTAQDLVQLNIHKIGHQEIILEAVELLRNLHYNITSETLQTIALRLACKSRALFNQLKKSAEAAANPVDPAANGQPVTHHHLAEPNHHHHGSKKSRDNNVNHRLPETVPSSMPAIDLSPVSTGTLTSVSEILAAVKDFISWIDRYPFDGNEKYLQTRKAILQLSIELASTAQRDQFVQGPNEVIRKGCKKLADLCDRLVQELNDSLAMQTASLEVVTVTKNMEEDLGMHIHSSYSGIHVVGGLEYRSPAHLNGNIEEGDEIVQVNYQTVVGWQLKKLVASMRRFPTKLILTVKKRPRHHPGGSFTTVPQFALPLPEMSIIGNSSLPSLGPHQIASVTNFQPAINCLLPPVQQPHDLGLPVVPHHYGTLKSSTNDKNNNNNEDLMNYDTLTGPPQQAQHSSQSDQQQQQLRNHRKPLILYNTDVANQLFYDVNTKPEPSVAEPKTTPSSGKPMIVSPTKTKPGTENQKPPNQQPSRTHHRIATARCSSEDDDDDDSSPLSDLSDDDDSSTMFSSDSSDEDIEEHRHNHRRRARHKSIKDQSTRTAAETRNGSGGDTMMIASEEEEEPNDNDSAFYSGRRTTPPSTANNDSSLKMASSSMSSASSSSCSSKKQQQPFGIKMRISKSLSSASDQQKEDDSGDSGIKERSCRDDQENLMQIPKTTAEFEEIYLKKLKNSTGSKSSTLPHNTHPNVVMISRPNVNNNSKNKTTQLTSVQLSTITHLTSLAKNIRFANMASVNNVQTNSSPHSTKSRIDSVLARKIEQAIDRLSGGDLVMGDHEDFLYTYKGSERIGGNHVDIPSSLGYITDRTKIEKWTPVRSVLRNNCLYSYQNDTTVPCFEIPIHLPGYYILVNKQMFLDSVNESPEEDDDDDGSPKKLVVFKLVTYHRLFMFSAGSLSKLVRWIVRFGYRFCCNPADNQLCFTYYLSPAHIGELPNRSLQTNRKSRSVDDNAEETVPAKTAPKAELPTEPVALLSESDDYYHDLLTVKSDDCSKSSLNDLMDNEPKVKFDPKDTAGGAKETRFVKTPHPRGSARFAVKPILGDDKDFIDSTVSDPKKTLEAAVQQIIIAAEEESLKLHKQFKPELPPRTSSAAAATTNEIPRPKPRISKMAVTGTGGQADQATSSPSKTGSLITSAAQRLAPATPSVPEKSASISQTIQHFANLQRQNNLRRSQQRQQLEVQKKPSIPPADYDYINPTSNRSSEDVKASESPSASVMSSIGNPLYSHVGPILANHQQRQSNMEREYQRLFGDKKPSEVLANSGGMSDDNENEEDDEDRPSPPQSAPPSMEPPPPPPTVDTTAEFSFNPLSSPKIQAAKRKTKPLPPPLPAPPKPTRSDSMKKTQSPTSPPTLLPRRPLTGGPGQEKLIPPPLPKTSHPQLMRSNSQTTTTKPPTTGPPVPAPKPDIKNSGKFLNRSLSDAAYGRSANMAVNGGGSIELREKEESPSSNRSLPTMGVARLVDKKRLSNVSADSSTVEKAISLYNQRRPSVSADDHHYDG